MRYRLGKQTITRIRGLLVVDTRDGAYNEDWDNADELDIYYCSVQPFPLAEKLNVEDNRARLFTRSALRVFAPPGSDVLYTDRIRYMGDIYDIFGFPGVQVTKGGKADHLEFIIRRREG